MMEESGKSQQLCHWKYFPGDRGMDGNAQKKKKTVLSNRVYIVNILLCNDAGHADQLLEDKAGLEKKSCASLQRTWKVPPGAGPKSCSNIHLIRSMDVKTGLVLHPERLQGEARALGAGRLCYTRMCYS